MLRHQLEHCASRIIRFTVAVCFAVTVLGFLSSSEATAQEKAVKEVIERSVRTDDGWVLPVTYYQSDAGKETPVVVLVHGEKGNRVMWKGLAKTLHDRGYAVVTFDFRKHGESSNDSSFPGANNRRLTPRDYQLMVAEDLEKIKEFLLEEHQAEHLNIRKTGFVCTDLSCPLVNTFALADWLRLPYPDAPTLAQRTPRGQDVRAIVMLSPDEGAPGVAIGNRLRQLADPRFDIAFLIGVGETDRKDRGAASRTEKKLQAWPGESEKEGDDKRIFLLEYKGVGQRGIELFQPQVMKRIRIDEQLVGFFDKYLKDLDSPWVSRKSRL
ncbi:alpha/beta hydrolase [Calycomorphotria hydatis]|uniref:Short chain dehydrogenase n=1 Tax=Calycomorphotria hydatis TaxID=2528027 RepID=A0A517T3C0_9PLAN|nr:alpha/beta fold hydrolase [Calycomorphotria hydatis]QDT62875.1 short chain dehydrogenase [Calycomorphotria hydatis]